MAEKHTVNAILGYLHHQKDITAWRANAGHIRFQDKKGKWRVFTGNKAGCPDIIGFIAPEGRFLGIECKDGKNTTSDTQDRFQDDMESKGALYILAYSIDDVIDALKSEGYIK